MKKHGFIAAAVAGSLLLSACSTSSGSEAGSSAALSGTGAEPMGIVATTFPEYDWVRQILGPDQSAFTLTLLSDSGVDLHSFEPSVEDIATIASADLFIYNGGESDAWVHDVLEDADNANLNTLSVMASLSDFVTPVVIVEGMQEDEHDHDDEHAHDESDAHEHDDEHVWLSLKNAIYMTDVLAAKLSELDAENSEVYAANAAAYAQQLTELDEQYAEAVATAARNTVLFADRFPFLYLLRDYNIQYYAAFDGCSAETEASFETVMFLTQKVDELDLQHILMLDGSTPELATTVINNSQNTEREVLQLNSMQSVTAQDIQDGATYLGIMQQNLTALSTALAQ